MKTFTTYAEKKAKQFFNLLQGYTKGIRLTAILILLLMGVGNTWARNVFLTFNSSYSWWKSDGAHIYAYFFDNGTDWRKMNDTNNDGTYECEIPENKYTKVIFVRKDKNHDSGDWNNVWNQTVDLTISDDQNPLFTIKGESDGKSTGSWTDTYTTATYDMFYIRGNFSNCSWDNSKHWQFNNSWQITKNITKGDYEFKIYASYNQWWGNNGTMTRGNSSAWTMDTKESNNCKITIDRTGDYTFTYDKSNRKLTVTYPEACFLVGSFNSWNENNTYSLINGSTTVHLTAGQHTFKIYNYSNSSSNIYYGNNGTMYRDNCTNWQMSSSEGNCTINADVEGDYIFTFDRSTMKLSVTYPQMEGCYLKGSFNNWSEDHSLESGSVSVELTKGNYTFKIYEGGIWYGNSGTMTRGNSSNWTMSGNTDCTITADITGNYTFTYNKDTKKLTVTYPEAYKVTYGVGTNKGTTSVNTDPSVTSGDLVLAATPITFIKGTTADGYTWKNWNSEADGMGTELGTGDTYVSSNRAGDISVYACYDLITYNITYNTNGGTNPNNAQTSYNVTTATFNLPTPTKTGYTFAGWYFESDFSGTKQTQITEGSTDNKTYYAKWTANTYTVEFNANGGSGSMTDQPFTYDEAAKALTANAFTRTGYTFAGWNTKDDGTGTSYTNEQEVQNLTADNNGTITLYAQWTINNYNITYTAPTHGNFTIKVGSNDPVSANTTADYNTTITLANNPATGYHFGSWDITPNVSITNNQTFSMPASNVTIGATFIPNSYIVIFNKNANDATGTMTNQSFTYDEVAKALNANAFTRTGYTFSGWNTNADGTGTTYTDGESVQNLTAENEGTITLYAKWTEILSTITITTNPAEGGNVTVDDEPFTPGNTVQVGVATSKKVTAVPNPGYGVAAWTVSNKDIVKASGGETVTLTADGSGKEGTLCANFVGLEYTITFNKQNGIGGTEKASVNYKDNNYSVDPVEVPNRTGYTFGGYYTQADGLGVQVVSAEGHWVTNATEYTDAEGKWVKADNVTLHAKWTESQEKHEVRVLYMCGDVVVKTEETIAVGEILPTSITAPAVTGYTFSEWKLGDGLVTTDNLTAQKINLTTKPSGDYTLTANYIKYQYTLTFGVLGYGGSVSAIADGNEIASPAPLGQDSKVTLTATAKDGYVFHKWINSTGAEVSDANPYEHTMTESTTINAVFKNTRMLYLKPNDGWKGDYARFAAYFYRNGSGDKYWADMTSEFACDNSNGIYKVPIPDGTWTHVIFVRMNPSFNENRWNRDDDGDNKPVWNQTGNLSLPTNENNLFELPTSGDKYWDGATTTWKKHTSTYEPEYLTYNVEVPAGTPNCYISGEINGWSFTEMEKVDDTHYTITIQDACPDDEYKYCYGPSWGCQEVKESDFTAINNRTHKNSDKVEAWIKYCIVGQDLGNWDWIDHFEFDLDGDINSLTHHLNQNTNGYNFKVKSSIGEYYTTDSQDGYKHIFHSMHTSEKIPQTAGDWHELILKVDVAGDHHFLFDPVSKLLTIQFPEKGYRLKITMTDGSGKVYTSNAVNNENETLSFFAPGANDTKLKGTITLEHEGQAIAGFTPPTITESGVYTAKLNSDKKSITTPIAYSGNYYIRTDGANGGWSNYKTDSDNKMTYFVPREEEKYSYYWVSALPRGERNTSNGVVNVKACVANDYNDNLATMLEADKFTSDNYGNVNILDPDEHHLEKINVRFGYNPKTNHFERAMLTGSGNINTFLNIFDPLPEGYLYKTNNNGALETRLTAASQDNKFTDISNWVYERDVWVNVQNDKDVTVCLTAVSYNGARNSLFGFDDADQKVPTQRTIVAQNSTPGPKKMRVIYDFKTNRMIMAWIPGAYACDKEEALIADVLFMRHENDPVPQLTMTDPDGAEGVTPQIKGIQTQFFALELENKGNQNYEEHYWITLPFNCIVGSISGVPGYMQTWGIQRYNGKKRAEKGWWKETETFWEWLGPDDVMEAGVGYVLSFDKSAATWNTFDVHEEDANGNIVNTTQKSLLRLYFPSTEKDFTFKANNNFVKTYANEPCEIKTANRHLQDGNWKIIGPLSYNSATATATPTTGDQVWQPEENGDHITVPDGDYNWATPMFLYEYTYDNSTQYNRENNWKYVVKNTIGYTYKAFFGYMVQFAGTMTWSEISQSVHPRLRARTYTDQVPTNITTNLDLVDAEGVQHDQTFVSLDIEGTTTYDLNKDLNKVFNNNFANIYTLSEGIPFAGNTLPMEKAIVPVGVRIATAGEYTFRMPDGTEGIYVTLIDNQTGTQTDMLMSEYTVTLNAGTIENRFYLVVDPDRTATSVENVGSGANGDEAKGVEKFLIDGKLFIRTADGIFDAKGQRL